jgi:hypothetical protein
MLDNIRNALNHIPLHLRAQVTSQYNLANTFDEYLVNRIAHYPTFIPPMTPVQEIVMEDRLMQEARRIAAEEERQRRMQEKKKDEEYHKKRREDVYLKHKSKQDEYAKKLLQSIKNGASDYLQQHPEPSDRTERLLYNMYLHQHGPSGRARAQEALNFKINQFSDLGGYLTKLFHENTFNEKSLNTLILKQYLINFNELNNTSFTSRMNTIAGRVQIAEEILIILVNQEIEMHNELKTYREPKTKLFASVLKSKAPESSSISAAVIFPETQRKIFRSFGSVRFGR